MTIQTSVDGNFSGGIAIPARSIIDMSYAESRFVTGLVREYPWVRLLTDEGRVLQEWRPKEREEAR